MRKSEGSARSHLKLTGHVILSAAKDLTLVRHFQGFPSQALALAHEALTCAETITHPYSITVALDMLTRLHYYRGEAQNADAYIARSLQLCTAGEFTFRSATSQLFQGWALMEQGRHEEGLASIREGEVMYEGAGLPLTVFYLSLMGEAYAKTGEADAGLAILQDAFAIIAEGREGAYEAELYRVKGELMLQRSKASLGQVKTS